MSKLCVQVESYLQQRFPITAANKQASNDRQLFSSTAQAVRGETHTSPKTIFKKNSEQVKNSPFADT